MSISQREFHIQGIGRGQCARILDALCYWPAGEWCPMPHLARVASPAGEGTGICVSRRIYDLRAKLRPQGWDIINESMKGGDGAMHSVYRLVKKQEADTVSTSTGTPTP